MVYYNKIIAIFLYYKSMFHNRMATTKQRPINVKEKYNLDDRVYSFIKDNAKLIVSQARADKKNDIPKVPLFDQYLSDLEKELRIELGKLGYFNGTVNKVINGYRNTFYYSSLPNLMEKY